VVYNIFYVVIFCDILSHHVHGLLPGSANTMIRDTQL